MTGNKVKAALWNVLELAMRFAPTLDAHVAPVNADRMNIGCGQHGLPGWYNLDNSLSAWLAKRRWLRRLFHSVHLLSDQQYAHCWPKNVVVHDVRRGLPCPDVSMRYIYTSHFLEHLYRDEARFVLRECYRVLVRGGLIRVVVPDLGLIARLYLESHTLLRFDNLSTNETLMPAEHFMEALTLRPHRVADRMPHRWMYDAESLMAELMLAGFVEIRKYEYRQGEMLQVEQLDVRPEDSLHMEARKPNVL